MLTDRESDSESEITGSHASQAAAKKIQSCACSVALGTGLQSNEGHWHSAKGEAVIKGQR